MYKVRHEYQTGIEAKGKPYKISKFNMVFRGVFITDYIVFTDNDIRFSTLRLLVKRKHDIMKAISCTKE